MNASVIIIGGGLSGIMAARQMHQSGIDFLMLEASDRIGGRIKTDVVDGFRLDHGFQVLLTAYPEAQNTLDYAALDLKLFDPGALLLYSNGSQDTIGDPLRRFSSLFPTLFSKAGNLIDKMKILRLRNRLAQLSVEDLFRQEEKTTLEVLQGEYGFSSTMIDNFFKPFFAGIFLEKDLKTSRRMFDFVFKMFGKGAAAIPNLGMEQIPISLAKELPEKSILTNTRVDRIENQTVYLTDGSSFSSPHIIIATEATGLIQDFKPFNKTHQSTTHVHFTADEAPFSKKLIALNTSHKRIVNNLCVINSIAAGYSTSDKALISLSIVGKTEKKEEEMLKDIKKELKTWFGSSVETWEHLHTRRVDYALPNQYNVSNSALPAELKIREGLYVCGDHLANGSINAAMNVGRIAGELVRQETLGVIAVR
ncbi:MAG: NAD(P)/FAD-dependent oxidoreductase [Bacteroidota bacterium]